MKKILIVLSLSIAAAAAASAQRGGGGGRANQPPQTAQQAAPIDLTGYWVSVVTEDWRWRMVTPPKRDYQSLPIHQEPRAPADGRDLAKDEASELQCKPYSAGNIRRHRGIGPITSQA